LEGYYQEIGRAGRDGKLSRTYLMHSYADQRTHDFFLNRDYPPATHLEEVFRKLGEEPKSVPELRVAARLSEEEFDKALEKLEIHGGARVDFAGNVTVGGKGWKKTYTIQAQYCAEQFAKVLRFTESSDCRMGALVRHFGDEEDAERPCGQCDVCDPGGAVLRLFRRATREEREIVQRIVDDLRAVDYKAQGTLQRNLDLVGRMSRNEFEALLEAMVRVRLIEIEGAEYEKDGETIRFRKVRLTASGLELRANTPVELLLSDGVVDEFVDRAPARARKSLLRRSERKAGLDGKTVLTAPVQPAAQKVAAKPVEANLPRLSEQDEALASRIRAWRMEEAKRLGVPPFLVLHDKSVAALAFNRPRTPNELLFVEGIGPAKAEKFGDALLAMCAEPALGQA
jgi:superfamily II DNA helicase RecQ